MCYELFAAEQQLTLSGDDGMRSWVESHHPGHIVVSKYNDGDGVGARQDATSSLSIDEANHETLVVFRLKVVLDDYFNCLFQLS